MAPVDVLEVREGQDRGARLGLLGSEAVIGRGPTMDLMLTDPRVSRRHPAVRVEGDSLTLSDLGSSGGTRVNGVPIHATTTLAVGDRVRLGETLLVVLWTPGPPPEGAPAGAVPSLRSEGLESVQGRPMQPAGNGIVLRSSTPKRRGPRPTVLIAAGALGAALLGLASTTMPALVDNGDGRDFWQLSPPAIGAIAALASVLALVVAGAWLAFEIDDTGVGRRGPLAMGAAAAGGLLAGIPLCVAAASTDVWGGSGLGAMTVAGLTMIALALVRLRMMEGPPPWTGAAITDPRTGLIGVAGLGGIVAALASAMTWVDGGGRSLSGLDQSVGVGRWLVPLALAMTVACVSTAVVGRVVDRRATAPSAAVALGLTALVLSFVAVAAAVLDDRGAGPGLVLAVTGPALAIVPCLFGAMTLARELRDPDRETTTATGPTRADRLG